MPLELTEPDTIHNTQLLESVVVICELVNTPLVVPLMVYSLPFSKYTFCGILKLPPFDFFLNFGKFACPLKKRVKALSKFLLGWCKDCELIS